MTNFASISQSLHFLFGGDVPTGPLLIHQAAARAVMVYLVGLAIIRIGKSRGIGRITPLDVILGFVLGSLLSRGITGNASLSGTAAASRPRRHALAADAAGLPVALVRQPRERPREPHCERWHSASTKMLHHHISIHDLEEALRMKGIDDIQQVRRAYKERNGEISLRLK